MHRVTVIGFLTEPLVTKVLPYICDNEYREVKTPQKNFALG